MVRYFFAHHSGDNISLVVQLQVSRDPVEWSYVERLLPTKGKIIKTDFEGMVINTFFLSTISPFSTLSLSASLLNPSPGETRVNESSRDMDGRQSYLIQAYFFNVFAKTQLRKNSIFALCAKTQSHFCQKTQGRGSFYLIKI